MQKRRVLARSGSSFDVGVNGSTSPSAYLPVAFKGIRRSTRHTPPRRSSSPTPFLTCGTFPRSNYFQQRRGRWLRRQKSAAKPCHRGCRGLPVGKVARPARLAHAHQLELLQESTNVPTAAVCANGQISGPSAEEPLENGDKDGRRR
jgi:hypothetical protein